MYKLIVWVSGRNWNCADSSGVASSLLRDGATLTATLSANPWGIESFFIRALLKEWGGNLRLSPCCERPLMIVSFFLCSFLIQLPMFGELRCTWWVTDEFGRSAWARSPCWCLSWLCLCSHLLAGLSELRLKWPFGPLLMCLGAEILKLFEKRLCCRWAIARCHTQRCRRY